MSSTTTPGAKMIYLIKRRPETSREELVAHWFSNHMPAVIERMASEQAKGRPHASRYIATLYDANEQDDHVWDGAAQLWFEHAPPAPSVPHGTTPADSFQERANPYVPWETTEHVVIDGSDRLPSNPLTLDAPFPSSRSGFFKATALVAAKPGTDFDAMFTHWLDVHADNVAEVMRSTGGWRYVISLSANPAEEPFAGMAELYFDDADGWAAFHEALTPDGFGEWADPSATISLKGATEFIGIPG